MVNLSELPQDKLIKEIQDYNKYLRHVNQDSLQIKVKNMSSIIEEIEESDDGHHFHTWLELSGKTRAGLYKDPFSWYTYFLQVEAPNISPPYYNDGQLDEDDKFGEYYYKKYLKYKQMYVLLKKNI